MWLMVARCFAEQQGQGAAPAKADVTSNGAFGR